ncbi:MAG: tyrosine-protein phosphatase [Candidatus Aenigmarchaeota archaeon]|nr:tyrosine-protein phosphatase [Candidatus Aenigmarchaeota archaeon]
MLERLDPWYPRFWEVVRNELYRSKQPTPEDLHRLREEYGIKTVINLRGKRPDEEWFQKEKEACEELRIEMHSVEIPIKLNGKYGWANKLLTIYRKTARPILVHCRKGSDRSGIASFLYLLQKGVPPCEAENQLSTKYGHFSIFHRDYSEFIRHVKEGRLDVKEILNMPCEFDIPVI